MRPPTLNNSLIRPGPTPPVTPAADPGDEGAVPDLVLFDADCPGCVALAGHAARRAGPALRFVSWQEFVGSPEAAGVLTAEELSRPADKLRAIVDGRLIEAEAVWERLLARHPDLTQLGWLASRLGLTAVAARALRGTGDFLRRFCRKCGRV